MAYEIDVHALKRSHYRLIGAVRPFMFVCVQVMISECNLGRDGTEEGTFAHHVHPMMISWMQH